MIVDLGLAVHLVGKYEVMLRTMGLLVNVVDMKSPEMVEELEKIRCCRKSLNEHIRELGGVG